MAYFAYVNSKLGISKDYDFEVAVTKAVFDEDNATWKVSISDGRTLLAKWLVLGVGFSSKPLIPDIQGLHLFQGGVYHTGAWPRSDVNFKGKRVAVIGTGTSAAQVIREIAPYVGSMAVYQRSPAVVLPRSPEILETTSLCLDPTNDKRKFFAAKSLSSYTGLDHCFLNPKAIPAGSPKRLLYYDYLYKKGEWNLLILKRYLTISILSKRCDRSGIIGAAYFSYLVSSKLDQLHYRRTQTRRRREPSITPSYF